MDEQISIGHPFYFPTQTILVDDDPDFLEGVSLMLDSRQSYQLFQSAHQALEEVNRAHRHVHFLKRCYANYKTGPMVSDSLSHIDIGGLGFETYNGDRFLTASTVVVDYSMPEMNGLEFLSALKNPFIRKVLLTGQGDMELAITAFNSQLIDQFIDKHDPHLKHKLNAAISTFQDQYFRNSFKLITDPILANNHEAFLVSTDFQRFFHELRKQRDIVEYYMTDIPYAGFLLVSGEGQRHYLLIRTEAELKRHILALEAAEAPTALLEQVRKGELLPDYDDQQEDLDIARDILPDWSSHYHPGTITGQHNPYFTTLLSAEYLDGPLQSIIPYNSFLQSSFSFNDVLH